MGYFISQLFNGKIKTELPPPLVISKQLQMDQIFKCKKKKYLKKDN